MVYFVSLIIAAGLGIIPGKIAEAKGYSFWLWWFYGWMLFIVALIHSLCMDDYNTSKEESPQAAKAILGSADELIKYKKMFN